MYVVLANPSPKTSARRTLRAIGDGIDWGDILSTGIQTAGSVAKVAVTPPMYSSVINPVTGQQSITSYAGSPGLYPASGIASGSAGIASLLNSPVVLLGGLALVLVLVMRK